MSRNGREGWRNELQVGRWMRTHREGNEVVAGCKVRGTVRTPRGQGEETVNTDRDREDTSVLSEVGGEDEED